MNRAPNTAPAGGRLRRHQRLGLTYALAFEDRRWPFTGAAEGHPVGRQGSFVADLGRFATATPSPKDLLKEPQPAPPVATDSRSISKQAAWLRQTAALR